MASVKWLQEITILAQPFKGFFQSQEYIYIGEEGTADNTPVTNMRVRSLILQPEGGAILEQNNIQVEGIAWSGEGKISKLELSFDEGRNWDEAKINPPNSDFGITHWEYDWKPEHSGEFKITARAHDSTGEMQPLNSRWNKGGYGNNVTHAIRISIK